MPLYLSRFNYTPESWAALVKNPEDRRDAVREVAESAGATLIDLWYSFGGQDGYALLEAPDNASAAAIAIAVSASGALASFETTVLMTVDETIEALQKAQAVTYARPGK